MRMTDRRRVGGAAAVVAAFWLGFVCGGGGTSPEAAASGQQPGAPAEASQPPDAPAGVPDAPGRADAVQDEESTPGDTVPAESPQEDSEAEAAIAPEPPLVQERPREFTAGTGMVLNFVRQGAESAYEETLARVAEALAASDRDERRQQAEGWRTFKAEELLADGGRLYVSWLDPVVPGADYWVPGILNEAFPTEGQGLYETYAGAFADGQILLNLVPVAGP